MFDDVPREHAVVYRNALKESFLPALSVGALGFCSGAIRLIAVTHQGLWSAVNIVSMCSLAIAVAVFFGIWRRRTIRVDLMTVLRVLFPIAATCLIVLPFGTSAFTTIGSSVTYACFMLSCVLAMMHCGQISRDSGINPMFVFAFYSAVAYFMQMCGYVDLKKAFYDPAVDEKALYEKRFAAEESVHLDVDVSGYLAFFVMTQDIYEAALRVSESDKELLRLIRDLPPRAIEQFASKSLIDEIVITNGIEGVNSTRREVCDVLDSLEKNDRSKRFHGLVKKYYLLVENDGAPLVSPADIRAVYDELVLEEILADDKKSAPDGELFRKDSAGVYSSSQKLIHEGLMPESAIKEALARSLDFLNGEACIPLARIAAFHFMFGYIHPFYDGNGRTSRYISSYYLANHYEPIMGYGLSYMIEKRIDEYYKGFQSCEGGLCKGDLTPFVIVFTDVVAEAAERMVSLLSEGRDNLLAYEAAASRIDEIASSKSLRGTMSILIQATLFSDGGITASGLADALQSSKQTPYRHLKVLEGMGLVMKKKRGKEVFHTIDLDRLSELADVS